MEKLPLEFYQRNNVLQIAKELLGKVIVTKWDRIVTSARIVETEAYAGVVDMASHAYGARRTKRNEVMYSHGAMLMSIYVTASIIYLMWLQIFMKCLMPYLSGRENRCKE